MFGAPSKEVRSLARRPAVESAFDLTFLQSLDRLTDFHKKLEEDADLGKCLEDISKWHPCSCGAGTLAPASPDTFVDYAPPPPL